MAIENYAGTHLQDFAPPWKETDFRGRRGFRIRLSRNFMVFAVPPAGPDRFGWEGWECQLLEGLSRRIKERFRVQVNADRNAAYEVLARASEILDVDEPYLCQAAEEAWRMMLNAQEEPAVPILMEPRPGRWYDPRKRLPSGPFPVTVAWTGLDGSKHGGDRSAFYKNGTWYWAFGEQDEIPFGISVDAWRACPARPPEWRRD